MKRHHVELTVNGEQRDALAEPRTTLADFLREQTRLGHLAVPNPEAAAEQFCAMVTAFQQFRALMHVETPPGEAGIEAVNAYLDVKRAQRL